MNPFVEWALALLIGMLCIICSLVVMAVAATYVGLWAAMLYFIVALVLVLFHLKKVQ
jgi:hypothetical protein